jgi:hypothetical protein
MKIFQKFKIYTQEDLVKPTEGIKDRLQFRINNYSNELSSQKEHKDFVIQYTELKRLQSDLRKVKYTIAINNIIFGVNNLIYKRESLKKQLDVFTEIRSKYRTKVKKSIQVVDYFMPAEGGMQSIEYFIDKLSKEIEVIDNKLTSRNKKIKCLIRLSENYK